jgi:hypothetical protein
VRQHGVCTECMRAAAFVAHGLAAAVSLPCGYLQVLTSARRGAWQQQLGRQVQQQQALDTSSPASAMLRCVFGEGDSGCVWGGGAGLSRV